MTAVHVDRSLASAVAEPDFVSDENSSGTDAKTVAADAFRRLSNMQDADNDGARTDANNIKIGAPNPQPDDDPKPDPKPTTTPSEEKPAGEPTKTE